VGSALNGKAGQMHYRLWGPWLFAETELAAKVEGCLDRGAGHRAGKAIFQPLNAQLREMNPVCYLKELSHSLLSGNGNCCFREFGQSTFGVHWRDPGAFCHSCNGSLTVKHAECCKEHLFSSRQVLWISLGYAYKQIDKYFSLPRASEEARSLDNSNGPAPSLKDQFSSPSKRPRYDSSATPARRRAYLAANGNLHGRHPGVALRENVGLRITS
jgi:hypothetical protein